jgi:hypothetical protein
MTIQTINIGNRVNDGLGDDLRTAFEKVNSNFVELESSLTITASNVGSTGAKVFKQKLDSNLEFRNLVSGRNMLLDEFENSIVINSTAPDAFIRFDTEAGIVKAGPENNGNITIEGMAAPGSISGIRDIEITANGNNNFDGTHIRIKTILPVTDILTTYDFGFINGSFNNAVQLAISAANIDFGTILLPGTFNLDLGKLDPFNTSYN